MTRPLILAAGLLAVTAAATPAAPTPSAPTAGPLAALENAKTIQVTETIQAAEGGGPMKTAAAITVQFSSPGLTHMEETSDVNASGPDLIMVSDGRTLYAYGTAQKQYRKSDAPREMGAAGVPGLAAIPTTAKPAHATLDGRPTRLYTTRMDQGERKVTFKLWEDAKTGLPVRQSVLLTADGATHEVQRTLFTGWVLDKPLAPSLFAFTPPQGATPMAEPMLDVGAQAPDFTVNDRDGKPIRLSDFRGKVVVLDFWATWCRPYEASLPHTNEVAQKFQGKNVAVLAVNVRDKQTEFDKWLPQHKQFDAITFAIDPTDTRKSPGQDVAARLYGVSVIPTQYIIGPDGKIVKSFVGVHGPSDDLANAIKAAGAAS